MKSRVLLGWGCGHSQGPCTRSWRDRPPKDTKHAADVYYFLLQLWFESIPNL